MTIAADRIDTETVAARREERLLRLLERASASSRFNLGERWLFGLGGALMVAGFVAVIIGWVGASRTILVAGQIPYLISGGLIGLGLIFIGGFLYFGHWVAVLVRESRERGAEDRDDLALVRRSLEDVHRSLQLVAAALGASIPEAALADATAAPASGPAPAPARRSTIAYRQSTSDDTVPVPVPVPVPVLVATPTGNMVHRPDCRAVVGREGLRQASPEEGLEPCGLCHPFSEDEAG